MSHYPKYWTLTLFLFYSLVCFAQDDDERLRLAELALQKGDFPKALTLLADQPGDSRQFHYIAGLAREGIDSLEAAAVNWEEYLRLTQIIPENKAYHLALGSFCLANNHLLRGNWRRAESLLRSSFQHASGTLPDTLSAKIWNSFGVLKIQQGMPEVAGKAFEQAIAFWQSAGRPERALIPRYYAARQLLWRDPRSAARKLQELLDLRLTPLDDLHPAIPALALSEAHLKLGNLAEARSALSEAEDRIGQYRDLRPFPEKGYHQSIKGLLHLREGRVDLATKAFASGSISDRYETLLSQAEVHYFRGLSLQYGGRLEPAIVAYQKALDVVSGNNRRLRATLQQLIGECHLRQNSFAFSLEQLEEASKSWATVSSYEGVPAKLLTAEALLGNGENAAAFEILGDAQRACLSNAQVVKNSEVDLQLAEVLQKVGMQALADPVLEALWEEVDALTFLGRARLFAGLAFSHWEKKELSQASKLSEQSIAALLEHWATLRGIKGLRLQRNYFDQIFRLGITCALAENNPSRAVLLAEVARGIDLKGSLLTGLPKTLDYGAAPGKVNYLRGASEALSSDQVLIYFLQSLDSLHAVVVRPKREAEVVSIGEVRLLDQTIEEYLGFLADPVTSLDLSKDVAAGAFNSICALSHELYQKTVMPLRLEEGEELLIVPDGKLHFISFASLLRQLPAQAKAFQLHDYLLYGHSVAYLPTISLLLNQSESRKTGEYELSAFAPSYGAGSSLPALLNNQGEVARLEEQFQGDFHYASQAVRSHLPSPELATERVLHLSMHAVFNSRLPDSSWLAFSGEELVGPQAWYFASEINQNFSAHPFVFLSACQTANGELYRGEGALSITRAMMAQGNRHIVSSLWNVDDGRAGRLISSFYAGLATERHSAKALRVAQLRYLASANAQDAYPYYWAGLMHYGIGTEVSIKAKFRYWYLLIGAGLLSFLGALWQVYRK